MRPIVLLGGLAAALMCSNGIALAQKSGGVLKMYHRDNPPSASIHEEATNSTVMPFMSLFNNLVLYDQGKPQNSPQAIVPDLAKSWSWSADGKDLTFKLQEGVKWHDGQPFTAKDVVCTFDLLTGKGEQKLRRNPRQSWYGNVDERHGQRRLRGHGPSQAAAAVDPVAARLGLLADLSLPRAGGADAHQAGRHRALQVRRVQAERGHQDRAGTPTTGRRAGPISTASSSPSCPTAATAMLSFVSGRFDITFPWEVTIPLLKDIKSQLPNAVCQVTSMNNTTNLILNRDAPPFDNPDLRRRWCWRIDRKAFIDILNQGNAELGGTMQPPKDGVWGLPEEMLRQRAGLRARRAEEPRGGPRHHEEGGLRPRQAPAAQDRDARHLALQGPGGHPGRPAQGDLDRRRRRHHRDLAMVHPRSARKDYSVGLNTTGNGVDDPDQNYFENFSCKSERNYTGYCNPEIEKLFEVQSAETDIDKRRKIVWEIDRKLLEDGARPVIMWNRAAICMQPYVKGYVPQVNSVYNGFRFEDVWLDK